MDRLSFGRRPAKSGSADSLVIFLHGYGADGADLLGLADPLGPHLPDTAFIAPNAPERCPLNPSGHQWFPIPWIDGSDEGVAKASMETSIRTLDVWLNAVIASEEIAPARTILVGFSQGTMMALHLGPRRPETLGGIVGFSGRLLQPENLAAETVARPPILLVHGDRDDVVPPASLPEAADALTAAEFEVYTHVSKGTAHGIAPDGLGVALQFIREQLG